MTWWQQEVGILSRQRPCPDASGWGLLAFLSGQDFHHPALPPTHRGSTSVILVASVPPHSLHLGRRRSRSRPQATQDRSFHSATGLVGVHPSLVTLASCTTTGKLSSSPNLSQDRALAWGSPGSGRVPTSRDRAASVSRLPSVVRRRVVSWTPPPIPRLPGCQALGPRHHG